jgi:hypothetical protein
LVVALQNVHSILLDAMLEGDMLAASKVGILGASAIAAVVGTGALYFLLPGGGEVGAGAAGGDETAVGR